uniref:Doublecortin domain-containing protein n=1 Tax=Syphacia muris TaxID=451379 RepID=A0A158R6C0_9BILA
MQKSLATSVSPSNSSTNNFKNAKNVVSGIQKVKPPSGKLSGVLSSVVSKRIIIYRNGDAFDKGLKVAVNIRHVNSIQSLLDVANEKIGLANGAKKLYTLSGQLVKDIDALEDGKEYVATSRIFTPLAYGRAARRQQFRLHSHLQSECRQTYQRSSRSVEPKKQNVLGRNSRNLSAVHCQEKLIPGIAQASCYQKSKLAASTHTQWNSKSREKRGMHLDEKELQTSLKLVEKSSTSTASKKMATTRKNRRNSKLSNSNELQVNSNSSKFEHFKELDPTNTKSQKVNNYDSESNSESKSQSVDSENAQSKPSLGKTQADNTSTNSNDDSHYEKRSSDTESQTSSSSESKNSEIEQMKDNQTKENTEKSGNETSSDGSESNEGNKTSSTSSSGTAQKNTSSRESTSSDATDDQSLD